MYCVFFYFNMIFYIIKDFLSLFFTTVMRLETFFFFNMIDTYWYRKIRGKNKRGIVFDDGKKKRKRNTGAIEMGTGGGWEAPANLQMEENWDWILRSNRTGNFLLTNRREKGGSRDGRWARNFTLNERWDTRSRGSGSIQSDGCSLTTLEMSLWHVTRRLIRLLPLRALSVATNFVPQSSRYFDLTSLANCTLVKSC